jgi:chromosome segregation ATPase
MCTIDGLNSELKHQALELNETRELHKIFEKKCELLIKQLTETNAELNTNKRVMIGYTQTQEEKEEKIERLTADLRTTKLRAEELHLAHGTLKIHHTKLQDTISSLQVTYDETVEKLHKMNKARHDLETKLTDEIERNRSLTDIVRLKEDSILKRQQELEEMDRKLIDLERSLEQLELKKQGVER